MRYRPKEPTAALAALISGNHRFLRDSAADVVSIWTDASADSGAADASPGASASVPIAVVLPPAEGDRPRPEVFGCAAGDLVVSTDTACVEGLVASGVPLVVVVERLRIAKALADQAFSLAEQEAFERIRRLLGSDRVASAAIRRGALRVVAALIEDDRGRVHWLGELPEQERLIGRREAPGR